MRVKSKTMTVKSKSAGRQKAKAKPKVKPKVKKMVKTKAALKARVTYQARALMKKTKEKAADKKTVKPIVDPSAPLTRKNAATAANSVRPAPLVVKRVVNQMAEKRRPTQRTGRVNQFSFMKAPGREYAYEVGGGVEVFCDHEKNRERIRGWVKGIVVQVDNKMVAVQFRSNVYLTDGWMVPDRILWFPLNSEHMRPVAGKKSVAKEFIPEY